MKTSCHSRVHLMNSRFHRFLAILFVATLTLASKFPPDPVEPSTKVTPESLLNLRSASDVENVSYETVETDRGILPMNTDGMSDLASATGAIKEAFPTLPLCREWPAHGETPRFPFAIDANERLVDALDKLYKNSHGVVDWVLLHGRVVVKTESLASTIMDRTVAVNLESSSLQDALEQIAAAYNDRYSDFPLVVWPCSPRLMMRGSAEISGQAKDFVLDIEGSMREVILSVMDQLEDPGVCYGVSDLVDSLERRYFALHPKKDDAPELGLYEDADEAALHHTMLEDAIQRLEEYFVVNAEKATNAEDDNATDGR